MQRALWLMCLLALGSTALAADRREVLIGPHLSSDDGTDSAAQLQGLMQAKINSLADTAFLQPELQAYIESHFANVKDAIKPPVMSILANAWQNDTDALMLIAGAFQQDQETFISTLYLGPQTADFAIRGATVTILARPEFVKASDMATLLFYYALVRDARSENKGRGILVPIASSALEIVAGLKATLTDATYLAMVGAIETDLNKVVAEAQVQP